MVSRPLPHEQHHETVALTQHLFSAAEFEEIRRLQKERNEAASSKITSKSFDTSTQRDDVSTKASLTESFDTTLYDRSSNDKFAGYNTSIPVNDDDEDMDMASGDGTRRLVGQYTATKEMMNEFAGGADDVDPMASHAQGGQIQDRETDYQKRRFARRLSPTRKDALATNGEAEVEGRSYKEVMQERELEREEERVRRKIEDEQKNGKPDVAEHQATLKADDQDSKDAGDGTRKRVRLPP